MEGHLRALYDRTLPDGSKEFVASTTGVKRDGLTLDMKGAQVDNYLKNPVVLWAHDYRGERLPIGKTTRLRTTTKEMRAVIQFDLSDPFAAEVDRKYDEKFLNAVSIGWVDLEYDEQRRTVVKWELLDISSVPVPGDPDALLRREYAMIRSLLHDPDGEGDEYPVGDSIDGDGTGEALPPIESTIDSWEATLPLIVGAAGSAGQRAAIPPHTTAKADDGAPWDGPGAVAACPAEAGPLRRMHAWVDPDGDPDAKQSYKLPHHRVSGEVVWRGVAAAMARLLQAGTQIPDGDRRGVWNHLERHYRQFDKEAPELRSLAEFGPRLAEGAMPYDEWRHYRDDLAVVVLSKMKELKDAIAALEAAIEPADESPPPPDPAVAEALSLLADALKETI